MEQAALSQSTTNKRVLGRFFFFLVGSATNTSPHLISQLLSLALAFHFKAYLQAIRILKRGMTVVATGGKSISDISSEPYCTHLEQIWIFFSIIERILVQCKIRVVIAKDCTWHV